MREIKKMNIRNDDNKNFAGYITSSNTLSIVEKPFEKGNFSLWYNKYIPIIINGKKDELYKPCNTDINYKNDFIKFYCNIAREFSKYLDGYLIEKHAQQSYILECARNKGLEVIEIWAQNTTRLLTGVGNSHPAEISITLDHNLGIPYIPASSIKGIVRFCNALGLQEKIGKDSFNDVEDWETNKLFGSSPEDFKDLKKGHEQKGSVIFFDVYPLPSNLGSHIELEVDILNPHYIKYYSPTNTKDWPSDNQDPRPVKFLVVKPGTYFIFRCIVPSSEYKEKIIDLFKKVFVEGIGAKTNLNYGRFKEINPDPSLKEKIDYTKQILFNPIASVTEEKTPLEESGPEASVLNKIKNLKKDRSQIGQLVKQLLEGDYSLEVYETLKNKLVELNEWEPEKGSAYSKMKERKTSIENKIKSLKEKRGDSQNA